MAISIPRALQIRLELIRIDDQSLRHDPEDDSIIELAQDIAAKGLLQPIGVSELDDGAYQLRWGGRRLAAHRRLGLKSIWARVWENREISVKALAVVENLQRRNLTLAEEVDAVTFMITEENKSIEQIAASLSKTRSWVLNRSMVPNLPDFLKEPLIAGDLGMTHVEVISRVPDDSAKRYLAGQCIAQRWNRSQLKTMADIYMAPIPPVEPQAGGIPGVRPNVAASPFYYPCEVCHEKGTLEEMTLVRVHKDGVGCRTVASGPVETSDRGDGLDDDNHRHDRVNDQSPD